MAYFSSIVLNFVSYECNGVKLDEQRVFGQKNVYEKYSLEQ